VRQRHVTLAIKRWACGPFCACCPARHAVVARLARTLGVTKAPPKHAQRIKYNSNRVFRICGSLAHNACGVSLLNAGSNTTADGFAQLK